MKHYLLAGIFFLVFFFPPQIHAHTAGQTSFFLINDEPAGVYPVYVTSLKNFSLPQDIAPEKYLVNTPLSFEIDTDMLPFPKEVIKQTTFSWDFGDGTSGTGLTNDHTYTKPGSYLLTITADYGNYRGADSKPLLQAVLLHVLPAKDYKLPRAVIIFNKKQIADPTANVFSVKTNEKMTFDASSSVPGSVPIVSYFWDRGDGTSTTEKSYTYSSSNYREIYIFPMLRVKDANGFISDTYMQLEKSSGEEMNKAGTVPLPFILAGVLLLNGIIITFVIFLLRRH